MNTDSFYTVLSVMQSLGNHSCSSVDDRNSIFPESATSGKATLTIPKNRLPPSKGPGSSLCPSSYSEICNLLIKGKTIHQICAQTKVSDYTIKGIKKHIRDQIPDWKKNISRRMEEVITELVDSLESDLRNDRLSPDRKAIAIGILVDKREKMGDSVRLDLTSRVTAETSQDFSRRLNKWMATLTVSAT